MKNPFTGLLLLACLFCAQFTFAQPICGFDALHGKAMKTDPEYRRMVLSNDSLIRTIIQEQAARKAESSNARTLSATAAVLYTIPVVIHVVHTGGAVGTIYNPSDADITGAINYLNQIYNGTYTGMEGVGDIQIQFALATLDPNCNPTNGIDRLDGSSIPNYPANGVNAQTTLGATEIDVKNSSRWNPYRYYNIWVVHKIDGKDGTSGQFVAGYARLAGASDNYDGTIMLATQMKAGYKTLPHEIGHALNLYHPFEGSPDAATCPPTIYNDCTIDGDQVCDTDPVTKNQTGGIYDFSCRTGTNTCTGAPYSIATEHNIMNYTNCFTLFTPGQKDRMLAAMWLPIRRQLSTSGVLMTTYPPVSFAPPAAACVSNSNTDGLTHYAAGILNVSLADRTFNSGPTADDNGYLNAANSCINLISLLPNGTYTINTTLFGINVEQVKAWIDYNNSGTFESNEMILDSDYIYPPSNGYPVATKTFTIPSSAVQNAVLRMRVTDELSTGYGGGYAISSTGCYNPRYGQTEDYPVIISATVTPVTIAYFKGANQGNANRLSWKTAEEFNSNRFDIERSSNGTDYSRIGTVTASGLAYGSSYHFNDNTYTGAINYYRLKPVDNNGSYTYSSVVIIKSETVTESSVRILTNPFHDHFDLSIASPVPAKCVVNLLDATGKLVYTETAPVSNKTIVSVSPRGKDLSAGLYIVQVQLNGKTVTAKLIKE